MLLLNAVHTLLIFLGLIVVEALRFGFGLDGFALIGVVCLVIFIVFCVGDLVEEALIDFFNR